jgi:hypothetical protein
MRRQRDAKNVPAPSCWLCRLIHHQLDGGVAAQSFGIGAGLVRVVYDALILAALLKAAW